MEQSNIDFNKIQNENNILSPNSARKADNIQIIKDTLPHDEPGLYHGLGVFSFATATLLLGISYWDGFDNKILLTVYGFFIGGLGQLICGIMCFKERYYIDGTVYFYFTFNWTITACYDLFPIFGWMDPLSDREYGYHNLMGCLFTLIFFLQNLNTPSLVTRISFGTTFISFVLSTIGSFAHST
jgi:succinate-acetate transporter protein